MNYFGHAVVATWASEDPAFVLGSMLPDFASMLGVRTRAGDAAGPLQSGLHWHHETDRVFHAARGFVDWTDEEAQQLRAAGLRRHPARAAAHVGVEMLIDGSLLDAPGAGPAYEAALELPVELAHEVLPDSWPSEDWAWLRGQLRSRGLPEHYRSRSEVAGRLVRALSRRPRLRLSDFEAQLVRDWLATAQGDGAGRRESILQELRVELAVGPSPG